MVEDVNKFSGFIARAPFAVPETNISSVGVLVYFFFHPAFVTVFFRLFCIRIVTLVVCIHLQSSGVPRSQQPSFISEHYCHLTFIYLGALLSSNPEQPATLSFFISGSELTAPSQGQRLHMLLPLFCNQYSVIIVSYLPVRH